MVAGNRWSSARVRGGIAAVALGCVALQFCWWTSGRYATAQEPKQAPTLSPTARQISPSRIGADLGYLASDELEGRGLGSEGLNKAADYIASEFAKAKLKTDLFEGKPFHTFQLLASVDRGPAEKNTLTFVGPPEKAGGEPRRITLKLEQDFQTLALGGSGKLDAPVVFAGYGITAKNEDYDDFAGLNVEGKIVVVIRREPQQNNPHSKFNGTQASQYAPFTRKVSNATEHGAAAIIMVNDDFSVRQARDNELKNWRETADKLADARVEFKKKENPSAEDEAKHRADIAKLVEQLKVSAERLTGDFDTVLGFQEAGAATNPRTIPVFFAKRAAVDPVVKAALGKDLATLEKEIDEGPKP
ncbi:MAG TPA: hypothetical protein PLV92_21935, partial [Pirellulaceae bacterium]|nr:hypothetical protein [Pirellulaceae bacterium]